MLHLQTKAFVAAVSDWSSQVFVILLRMLLLGVTANALTVASIVVNVNLHHILESEELALGALYRSMDIFFDGIHLSL